MPEMPAGSAESDFHFIDRAEPEQIAATVLNMVKHRIPAKFGLDPIRSGEIRLRGVPISPRSPEAAMRYGIGLLPEDRKRQGLVLGMSLGANLSLTAIAQSSRLGFINRSVERGLVASHIAELRIKTPGPSQLVANLSGGNQQKVVLAKWLATNPRILIVDEPTRGVDIGSKADIYALMRKLAESGLAILMISSDLPEVLAVSDRILVMRDGRISGALARADATEEVIMQLAALDPANSLAGDEAVHYAEERGMASC